MTHARRQWLGSDTARAGRVGVALCAAVLACVPALTRASDGSTGGVFLQLGHGARAHGLGGAGAALLRDDTAIYWNPANLAFQEEAFGLTLMRASVVPEIDDGYTTLSFGRRVGDPLGDPGQAVQPSRWAYGLFVSSFAFSFDSGTDWSENMLQFGGAYALSNYASVGVAFKTLRVLNDFDSADATGAGLDLGLTVLVFERLGVAVVGRDAWTRVSWDTGLWETLEPNLTVGTEYRPHPGWAGMVDFTFRESRVQQTTAALEWRGFDDLLALRGAYTSIDAGESRSYPSAGIGVHLRSLSVDWGASFDEAESLDVGQRVSVQLAF